MVERPEAVGGTLILAGAVAWLLLAAVLAVLLLIRAA